MATEPIRTEGDACRNDLSEAFYGEHAVFLARTAASRFQVPHDIAENFSHDALISYAESPERIEKPRSWLLSHVYNSCRYYWRCESRVVPMPAELLALFAGENFDVPRTIAERLDIRRAVAALDTRCQAVLRLRFVDERSAKEMGEDLGTTRKYAEKLLYDCVDRVRKIYNRITRARR